jgi:hypothetical protein
VSAEFGTDATTPDSRYEFHADLPLRPVAHGTSVVVRGDSAAAPGDLALRLLSPVPRNAGGTLLIDTDDTSSRTANRWTSSPTRPPRGWPSSAATVAGAANRTDSVQVSVSRDPTT